MTKIIKKWKNIYRHPIDPDDFLSHRDYREWSKEK
jgi:hypothetical protein